MTSSKNILSQRPAAAGNHLKKWQGIIWREWRNSDDEEYARHLFELVANASIERQESIRIIVLGAICGAMGGVLLGLASFAFYTSLSNESGQVMAWVALISSAIFGSLIGGGGGLLIRRLWGERLPWSEMFRRLVIGVIIGWVLLCGGAGYLLPLAILFGVLVAIWRKEPLLNLKQFDLLPAGLAIGFVTGWCPMVILLGGAVALLIWLGLMLLAWWSLTALLAQLREWVEGSPHTVWRHLTPDYQGRLTTLADHLLPHKYRAWCFWWQKQPEMTQVETALRQVCAVWPKAQKLWAEPLRRLEAVKQQPDSPNKLIIELYSDDWVERLTARYALVALGGEAVTVLERLAKGNTSSSRRLAIRLLGNIDFETRARWAGKVDSLLCLRCLTRCQAYQVHLSWQADFTFYGCRVCYQSREFVDWPGRVTAVLDADWGEEQFRQGNVWRVNWLQRRSLFDFDEVEIVQASDEDVERFTVQVGNDTDPARQPRYKEMRCLIAPQCRLSENTLRILRRAFGQVEPRGELTIGFI